MVFGCASPLAGGSTSVSWIIPPPAEGDFKLLRSPDQAWFYSFIYRLPGKHPGNSIVPLQIRISGDHFSGKGSVLNPTLKCCMAALYIILNRPNDDEI